MKYAVLGSPIAHSRSPQLQGIFAKYAGLDDFSYERIETDCASLKATVERLKAEGYAGFNCTMPLKTDMADMADKLTNEAKMLRSVNTVAVRNGILDCTTTDGGGIILTIKRALGEGADKKKVLLLGAGGAARSAALSLALSGAELTVLNRSVDSAKKLCEDVGGRHFDVLNDQTLAEYSKSTDILINCTSLGMSGKDSFKSLDFISGLRSDSLVIDAVYNPLETELLKAARAHGLVSMSGLWMLVYQGALAFEWWTGILPDENACAAAFEYISL